MKLSDLETLVCSLREDYELGDDAEILVADADGWLHDFALDYMEETFDGFYTSFPAGIKIVVMEDEQQP